MTAAMSESAVMVRQKVLTSGRVSIVTILARWSGTTSALVVSTTSMRAVRTMCRRCASGVVLTSCGT